MLEIKKEIYAKIIKHLLDEKPNEACGFLAGHFASGCDVTVEEAYPVANTLQSPTRYLMDSNEQFQAMKTIRNEGLELVGIYHSHPDSEAYPSGEDQKRIQYERLAYMIVSLQQSAPKARSFRIENDAVMEEKIEIVDN